MATLLLDLLTSDEEQVDQRTRELRFNIGLLSERLVAASEWAEQFDETRDLMTGYFGASTGAAADVCRRFPGRPTRSGGIRITTCLIADPAHRWRQR
jgi:hypothetical protein